MSETSKLKANVVAEPTVSQEVAKRPYAEPALARLGRVAELTMGGGSVIDDGGGTQEGHA